MALVLKHFRCLVLMKILMSKGNFEYRLDNDLRGIMSEFLNKDTSYFSLTIFVNIILNNFGGYCF
jgi:hypothetical protein